jgi:ABC-type transporter Mla subunit MlaD
MDNDALDDLVRRLTALVVKTDERDTQMVEMLEELRTFNRTQVRINAEVSATLGHLTTLMAEGFRDRDNGHEA